LPLIKKFVSHKNFYNTAFLELVHWTGHTSRLNRPLDKIFGFVDYAKEELITELGAAFLVNYLGYEKLITSSHLYTRLAKCFKK